jgi:hypothetical protein
VLSRQVSESGAPLYLRSDKEPEFISRAVPKWIVDQGIGSARIDPGKPWQSGALESLSAKFRNECLSMAWGRPRGEAKVVIAKPRASTSMRCACIQASDISHRQSSPRRFSRPTQLPLPQRAGSTHGAYRSAWNVSKKKPQEALNRLGSKTTTLGSVVLRPRFLCHSATSLAFPIEVILHYWQDW